MQITIEIPDALGRQLQRFQDRLPELLERGLSDMASEDAVEHAAHFQDESTVLELLADNPSPEQILALQPAAELQERMETLLKRHKEEGLTRQEELELERYLMLEHLVRLAKGRARQQRRQP